MKNINHLPKIQTNIQLLKTGSSGSVEFKMLNNSMRSAAAGFPKGATFNAVKLPTENLHEHLSCLVLCSIHLVVYTDYARMVGKFTSWDNRTQAIEIMLVDNGEIIDYPLGQVRALFKVEPVYNN